MWGQLFVDSHAHLADLRLYGDIDEILKRAKEAKLSHIVNICTDLEDLEKGLEIAKKYPFVVNAASTTPHDAHLYGNEHFSEIEKAALRGDLRAIGETGLEYFQFKETKEVQKALFIRYLQLAKRCQLPVVIHCRDGFDDLFQILDSEGWGSGVLHCFTGNLSDAEEIIKHGWMISLSGIVTFKGSSALREIVKVIPLKNLVIETDAPWLAPQLMRGKRNEPAFVVEVAKVIAEVKSISLEEVAATTSENAKKLFNLDDK